MKKLTGKDLQNHILNTVNERGFYLYEWISEEEFRKSIRLDYFTLLEKFGIAIAIFSFVMTFLGGLYEYIVYPEVFFGSNSEGNYFLWILIWKSLPYAVGSIFLGFLILIILLNIKTFQKGKIYRKIANITVVDKYAVTNGNIIPHEKFQNNASILEVGKLFHERPFEISEIAMISDIQEQNSQKKMTSFWKQSFDFAKSLLKNQNSYSRGENSDNIGAILLIVLTILAGIFFGMMKIMHWLFLPIIGIFSRIFANISYRILLFSQQTEYTIQNLFEQLDKSTKNLKNEKENIIFSLNEAKNNNWTENLSGKINTIFQKLDTSANNAISQNLKLKKTLENSHYKDIFNFGTFHNWTKKQILEPITSLNDLLQKNEKIITKSREKIQTQIQNTADENLKKPLLLQEKRLEIQIAELQKMQKILNTYQSKLL